MYMLTLRQSVAQVVRMFTITCNRNMFRLESYSCWFAFESPKKEEKGSLTVKIAIHFRFQRRSFFQNEASIGICLQVIDNRDEENVPEIDAILSKNSCEQIRVYLHQLEGILCAQIQQETFCIHLSVVVHLPFRSRHSPISTDLSTWCLIFPFIYLVRCIFFAYVIKYPINAFHIHQQTRKKTKKKFVIYVLDTLSTYLQHTDRYGDSFPTIPFYLTNLMTARVQITLFC